MENDDPRLEHSAVCGIFALLSACFFNIAKVVKIETEVDDGIIKNHDIFYL
jgi:hypothetical protein